MRSALRSLVNAGTSVLLVLLLLQVATLECWSNPLGPRPASQCCNKGRCPTMPAGKSTCKLLPATPQNAALPQVPEWTPDTTLVIAQDLPIAAAEVEPAPIVLLTPPDLYLHNAVLLI